MDEIFMFQSLASDLFSVITAPKKNANCQKNVLPQDVTMLRGSMSQTGAPAAPTCETAKAKT